MASDPVISCTVLNTAQFETQGVRKDGSLIDVEIYAQLVTWDDQEAVFSTVLDIAERKRTGNKLKESEAQYRNILDGSLQGILILDSEKILYANATFAQLHGYDGADEIIGIDPFVLINSEDRQFLIEYTEERLENDCIPIRFEYRGQRKDGGSIWLDN